MKNTKAFGGTVLFLDRDNINTDEIIPAKYLSEITKEALKPYLLEDLNLENFDPKKDIAHAKVVVTRNNFGCGSCREHAPWALEVNGITLVIAEGFARIFRQNMYNCGMLAVELPKETISMLFDNFSQTETEVSVDLGSQQFTFRSKAGKEISVDFSLAEFDKKLITSGGWVEFADTQYHV
ncbi:MAG: 3-isopropylmalate dehydratase small subunit [Sphaerochaetaceae bacterium]|nr:3-isopropylmalate dehydratase small subunit [Sphaerochaetaceae bacterium]